MKIASKHIVENVIRISPNIGKFIVTSNILIYLKKILDYFIFRKRECIKIHIHK